MELSDHDLDFIRSNNRAAMITVGADGNPKAARIGIGLVDGRLWSSGTQDRLRTRRLRLDPRCTLFVFDLEYAYLTLETTVTILEGPDVAEKSLHMFRLMQNKPAGPLSWFGGELDDEQFLDKMVEEGRIIYEFDVQRAYGLR